MKTFIVDLFFKSFLEKLLTKDYSWEKIVDKEQNSENDELMTVIGATSNFISSMFNQVRDF